MREVVSMNLIKLAAWCGSWLAAALVISAQAAAQCPPLPPKTDSAGHILTIKGAWRLRSAPQAELPPGCQLAPGAEITPPPKFASGYAKIAILERSGNLRVRTCNANQDCAPPLFISNTPQTRQGIWTSLVEEIMRKLRGAPDVYVSTITQGDGQLDDAIVQQFSGGSGGIDFSPIFKGFAPKDYGMEFARLDAKFVNVQWNGTSSIVEPAALAPGLYKVRLKQQGASDAWILIVLAGAAEDALKRETELKAVMNGWTENADIEGRNARRTLYRAFLAATADKLNVASQ
jgi:hypothetical protein